MGKLVFDLVNGKQHFFTSFLASNKLKEDNLPGAGLKSVYRNKFVWPILG